MATENITATTTVNPSSQVRSFFSTFDQTKDIVTNPSKLYVQRVIPSANYSGTSQSNGIYTYSTGSQVFATAFACVSGSTKYGSLQALLRQNNTNTPSSWIPVSSSTFNMAANHVTCISFTSTMIGDKLNIKSGASSFHATFNSVDLYAVDASQMSGFTYDINPIYTQHSSNFAFLFTSSSDRTMNTSNFKGLLFGQLGLALIYNNAAALSIGNLNPVNVNKQQRLNSKTFFCRLTNQKFNASNNDTWMVYDDNINGYVIRNGQNSFTCPTTIGLYNDQQQLLAIAKLSQPVLKYIDSQLHVQVVLQY